MRQPVGLAAPLRGARESMLTTGREALLTNREIVEALDMRRAHVTRATRKLEELGIILCGPKVGRAHAWRLNPNAGRKGKLKELQPALQAVA